jgi:hypothetical protein
MKTEQEQLLASLPGFIDTIEATFPIFDTHIMVADRVAVATGHGQAAGPAQALGARRQGDLVQGARHPRG